MRMQARLAPLTLPGEAPSAPAAEASARMLRFDAVLQQAVLRHAFAPGRAEPRSRAEEFQALLLENVHDSATAVLGDGGRVKVTRLSKALGGPELIAGLQDVHVLGIRSRTQIDQGILAAARHLVAIGCFSVGTSQVDLDAARRRGIPVFNAPFSNTRSVAELVIGEIIMLFRRVFQRSVALHSGEWQKNASASYEVRGKTLGIVGYGSIGSQLSNLAAALGMRVTLAFLNLEWVRRRHGG